MYRTHFGLSEPPFKITPHPGFFFEGAQRGAMLDGLLYAVTSGEGIVEVVGEVGSGKTMLCRMLIDKLPDSVDLVYLANPSYAPEDILYAIADELKLAIDGLRAGAVMKCLQQSLIERYAANRQVVVLIDEAHAMPAETLEQVRLLSNLENGHHKLLQMVLFGQPELDRTLALPSMRQLKERIVHHFALSPLRREDVGAYLMFRMRAAGYKGPDNIERAAVKLIAKASQGLTRRINILADKALLAAFADGAYQVSARHARLAARDSGFLQSRVPWSRLAWGGGLLAAGVMLGLGLQAFSSALQRAEPQIAAPPARLLTVPSRPVAAAPLAPQPAAAAPADAPPSPVLQPRLDAATTWLDAQAPERYTLQLLSTPQANVHFVEQFLKQLEGKADATSVHVVPFYINALPHYGVFLGDFADRAQAQQARANLPRELALYRPLLRTIQGVKDGAKPNTLKNQAIEKAS